MTMRLPSRYEDLDPAFRGRLEPNPHLIDLVQRGLKSMQMSGGIKFLPIYGPSGSGKSSAARELQTHLPDIKVIELSRAAISSESSLVAEINAAKGRRKQPNLIVAVIDQYEENVATRSDVPTQFVERLSLLDRGDLRREPVLFIWLTTSQEFQSELAEATSRNTRILLSGDFRLDGPPRAEWSRLVEETFEFHNADQPLADFEVLRTDIDEVADKAETIGQCIEGVADLLMSSVSGLQDLSKYQVIMLWPVTDGRRIALINGFSNPRDGYKLDWGAFYRELNDLDRRTLPLSQLNRARLYFDVRLIPIAAADLHKLCHDLTSDSAKLHKSYLDRFSKSHFASIVSEAWDPTAYSTMRERETSNRANEARDWYSTVTTSPTAIGKRIARVFQELGYEAKHEKDVVSKHSTVRADVFLERPNSQQNSVIVELKAFAPSNTMPSTIKDAIKTTLKRHAQFGGFLGRQ
ncbi:AAA family ATPase [Pseudarthrobacter sp. SSS035]|uniref:AAA family ATPase n=1 Tax=Pseudarthrobacter sp. SSS035 TaxID=2931399 RepID=UPI00200CF36F|nr:AAA family ATPase [Pseudarthrobacter sp. SSS035]